MKELVKMVKLDVELLIGLGYGEELEELSELKGMGWELSVEGMRRVRELEEKLGEVIRLSELKGEV